MSNQQFNIVSLPNSAAPIVYSTLSKHPAFAKTSENESHDASKKIKHFDLTLIEAAAAKKTIAKDPANTCVFLINPARRLFRAHRAMETRGRRISFEEFYRQPSRQNMMSKTIGRVELEQLGFVGISEHVHRSLVLLEGHLELSQPLTTSPSSLSPPLDLSDEVLDDIKRYHQEDFLLYERALSLFEQRWSVHRTEWFKENSLSIPAGKKVIIHVGPPKTGTSAIQAWLLENRELLASQGYFYPQHTADSNSVSSGNFKTILTRPSETTNFRVDPIKLKKLLSEFRNSHYSTLLLSSEHFFFNLTALLKFIPDAKIIFYIRHPLLSFESGYHQGVKRHTRTTPITAPVVWRFTGLELMIRVALDFDANVDYRYYNNSLYQGDNLINDFCQACGIEAEPYMQDKRINSSYSFEALELMRLFNQFCSEPTRRELDRWFQTQSEGQDKFTLLENTEIENAQQQLRAQIPHLCHSAQGLDKANMHFMIDDLPTHKFESQDSYGNRFTPWFERLKSDLPELAERISFELHTHKEPVEQRNFLKTHLKLSARTLLRIGKHKCANVLFKRSQ